MTERQSPKKDVLAFALRPREFVQRVREIAADSSNIHWSDHAWERMEERGISSRVAIDTIREGDVVGPIEPGNKPGEWKAKLVKYYKGQRDVGVAVITINTTAILVKTTEWEDPK